MAQRARQSRRHGGRAADVDEVPHFRRGKENAHGFPTVEPAPSKRAIAATVHRRCENKKFRMASDKRIFERPIRERSVRYFAFVLCGRRLTNDALPKPVPSVRIPHCFTSVIFMVSLSPCKT